LYITSGYTASDIFTDALKSTLYTDKLQVVNLGANYDLADSWAGSNMAQVTLSQGLNLPGVTTTGSFGLSRADGHSDFTKVAATADRLQPIGGPFQFFAAVTGQYSWAPLLSSQQFGFGGQQFGRGYDSSELTGDDGIAGSIELRYAVPPIVPRGTAEAFTFYDIGKLWNYGDFSDAESAASAGFGLRFAFAPNVSGSLILAKPLTRKNTAPDNGDGKDPRGFFSVTARF
jgi:hemolysin activation/secretion protein